MSQEVSGENIIENTTNDSIISEVKLRTPIWDMKDKSYKDQVLRKKIWEEIAFNLEMDGKYTNLIITKCFCYEYRKLSLSLRVDSRKKIN